MRNAIKDLSSTARMTEWLKRSGLNPAEVSLADVHQKTATILVDLMFDAAAAVRSAFAASRPTAAQLQSATAQGPTSLLKIGADGSGRKAARSNKGIALLRRLT